MNQYLEVTITETERIEVEFVEKNLITVNFDTVQISRDIDWISEYINNYFIYNEVPVKITSQRFRAENEYRISSLQVFLNGIKEKNITIHSTTEFSLPIGKLTDDDIEISYIKK